MEKKVAGIKCNENWIDNIIKIKTRQYMDGEKESRCYNLHIQLFSFEEKIKKKIFFQES